MKLKNLLAVLLSLAMLCGMVPSLSFSASAATPTLTTDYEPGTRAVALPALTATDYYRHAGWMVRYDYGFDAQTDFEANKNKYSISWYSMNFYTAANRTATNQWGTEIAVNQFGYVIDKTTSGTGGNMVIPEYGYVLSAVNDADNGNYIATTLANTVNIGDYIFKKSGSYYVYKTTKDSKFTDASSAFDIKKTQVLEIVEGGNSPTKTTHWTTTLLCKATGTGADGVANHAGYFVKLGGEEIDPVPAGYFAIVVSGTPLKDGGLPSYNAAMLFEEFVAPGSVVNIGSNEIYFRHDVAAAKRAARLISGTTDSSVTAIQDFSAATILNDAKTKYELVDTARMQELYDNMVLIADAVQSMTTIETMEPYMATLYQNYEEIRDLEFEVRPVEMRALWWRPLENDFNKAGYVPPTAAELDAHIEENVRRFKELGYNQLFVEGFYNSCTVFPVPETAGHEGLYYSQHPYLVPTNVKCGSSGLYGKNPNLSEPYDMLQRTIEVCEQYDIECHLWWQVLYIGYERHAVSPSDDLVEYGVGYTIENDIENNGSNSKYYNWLNVAQDGSLRSGSTSTLTRLWLNPANEDVRTFLLNLLDYVCATYDVYSFQLDYFRHPNDGIHEFGYDTDTVAAFKKAYPAYANTDLTLKANWKNADWLQFRADYITSLIGEMYALLKAEYPHMSLTASPDPTPETALRECLQDITAWLGNGYIDNIYPMAYGVHLPGYATPILVEQNAERFVSTGLSVGYENEALEMEWVRQIRHAGADGVAHFGEISHYKDTIWSEPAVSPSGNPTVAATTYLDEVVLARAAKMKEFGDITTAKYNTVKAAIEDASTTVKAFGVADPRSLAKLDALQTVANTLGTNPKAALTGDIDYLRKIRNNARVHTPLTVDNDGTSFIPSVQGAFGDKNFTIAVDGVERLWFDNVTATSGDSYALYAKDKETAVMVELTGNNTFTFNNEFTNLSDVSYCGTGALYFGSKLQFQMGDVDGNDDLDTIDIRDLIQVNVKLQTLDEDQEAISDANGDGVINTIDTRIFLDACLA